MKKNNIEGWLFVSPLVIWISLIILVPIYIAFELSLFNVKIIGTSGKFVGFDNYIKLISKAKFLNASLNSLYIGLSGMQFARHFLLLLSL